MKDSDFRAFVGVVQDHFDDLCWGGYISISIWDMIWSTA